MDIEILVRIGTRTVMGNGKVKWSNTRHNSHLITTTTSLTSAEEIKKEVIRATKTLVSQLIKNNPGGKKSQPNQ